MTGTFTVVFTPRAERQLQDLYSYITDHGSEGAAQRFVGGIVESCTSLSTFPKRGTKRDDIRPNLRTFGHGRRVTIAFSIDSERTIVAIHGVYYGGQDFESLLRDPDD